MIKIIAKVCNLTVEHVKPNNEPTSGAVRPYDCEFDCSDLETVGIGQRTPFEKAIKEHLYPFLK